MKKNHLLVHFPKRRWLKILLAMKLVFFLTLAFSLSAAAGVYSQDQKVSFEFEDAEILDVLNEIKTQTGLCFIYNEDKIVELDAINIDVTDKRVDKVLDAIFENTNMECKFQDEVIMVVDRVPEPILKEQKEKKTINGKVIDNDGLALPGVTVIVKGSFLGTTTDVNGKYKIVVPEKAEVLVYSFVGMINQEITLGDKTEINVTLQSAAEKLKEIVVTGYQKIEKRKLSSSVITVNAEQIKEGGALSVDNMLQGKIAGLSVVNNTSTPGVAPKIRIRGASSISGNREPVWVVDGVILEDPVPLSPTELNSLDNINLIGNAISSLNPEDIERIDVLKDASATAIYGVKAANGVIVITTKKGKIGPAKVQYSTNFTFNERPSYKNLNRMNSKERIDVSKEAVERGLLYNQPPAHVSYEGALYDFYAKKISYTEFLEKVKFFEEQNTDWLDILFRNSVSQKHNLSISGANEKTNYYFSGGFTNSNGTFKGNDLKQYNATMKINSKLTEKLNVGLQLRVSASERNYQHSAIDPFQYAYQTSRAISSHNQDGSLSYYNKSQGHDVPLQFNILNELDNSGRNIENQSLNFVANLNYQLLPDLRLGSVISLNRSNTYQKEWFNDKTHIAAGLRYLNLGDPFPTNLDDHFYTGQCELPYGGQITNDDTKHTSYSVRSDLNYKKTFFDKHEISTTVGTEFRSSQYDGIKTTQMGYLPDRGNQFVDADMIKFPKYRERVERFKDVITDRLTNVMSFYGTFTYSYDYRYIANFNIRADGSNKFGQDKDNRFLPVWSVSGRWNMHNEKWFKNMLWLNQLSIRGSYGVQGNIASNASPNLLVNLGSRDATSGHLVSTLDMLPNPMLRWEKTKSYNLALDFTVFNGRISGNVDLYKKKGEDMIVSRDVSITTGSNSMTLNAGNIENKGFDININMTPIRSKNFTWNLSVNGGRNINTVTDAGTSDLTYEEYLSGNAVIPGKALNSFYSYKFGGLDENGLPTYKDIEETDGITKEEMYAKMLAFSGKRTPDIEGGFSTTLRYKKWSIGAIFFYSLGRDIRLNPLYESTGQHLPNPQQNMDDVFVNRWRKPGDEKHTNIPTLSNDPLDMTPSIFGNGRQIEIAKNKWEMYNKSDLRVASGDYLRLRTLSLKHSFSEHICDKLHVSDANFRVEVSNVWTLKDKKLRGRDPEQISFSKNTGAIPMTPTYTLGFDVTF
ncbi:SusC/RagA family TonB-linked outer membrane protein [Marinifilum sp. N1E240]|uniref:SusC/RagA family TonB-linked outer membrane protein n=1 Tax=Marinifilum sp. N1E240 TaxID=2608082 RepID=UPI00128B5502|nr:SusC/RagA family TonB-linked outer membrane protein [Marinifilum sp. N1E240]MPQ46345.1 SusC/RagA family TonB-linked outer membrane protein [Marinifilum sp. N1E240]